MQKEADKLSMEQNVIKNNNKKNTVLVVKHDVSPESISKLIQRGYTVVVLNKGQ